MAPCTPVSPPQAFPFNSSSRRVSAPPPAPLRCADDRKRRSILSLTGSAAKCRRRLCFSEESSSNRVDLPSAVIHLRDHDDTVRLEAWREIASFLHDFPKHPQLPKAVLQPVLEALRRHITPEITLISTILPQLLSSLPFSDLPDIAASQSKIICAVMDAVCAIQSPGPALEAFLCLLRDEQCGRLIPDQTAARAHSLMHTVMCCFSSSELTPREWSLLNQLVAIIVDACDGACLDSDPFTFTRQHAISIINSFDNMSSCDEKSTIAVLDTFKRLTKYKSIAILFIRCNIGLSVAEVSQLFSKNLTLQHKCVDVLVQVSSSDNVD
ncbi:hypothetical protein BWQ96_03211 [Gracilariopsis chorda]|uniref:Uncharacterized protein n=1 Tax=Gracilariopsis chorda TaxID=448386 RepID=A0A2V3IY27_9FLOR|nr:hypothetical protein BWQ96_03211 [Gracilariopsis chorda]|eukprot:PXF47021.1 hypothetical protein BWQ96_03211 [Gracilariopsis chorda]